MLRKNPGLITCYVITTRPTHAQLQPFRSEDQKIRLIRLGSSGMGMNTLRRLWNYCFFFAGSVCYLVIKRPKRILYYETISSFPVWLYKKFINRKAEILVHYHEYTSVEEYNKGMWLARIFHRKEMWLYPRAKWVSHTNESRMKLFEQDILPVTAAATKVVPNYPPRSWYHKITTSDIALPVKIVYIGALGMDTTYVREFAEWVQQQKGAVIWHIFSTNMQSDVQTFLRQMDSPYIGVMGSRNYDELPAVLSKYDVGVILYKGHIANYVYNAPNKLFEYLACGLDVWYPRVMQEIGQYRNDNNQPKIVEVDFNNLQDFDRDSALKRHGLAVGTYDFFCEEALAPLVDSLCG